MLFSVENLYLDNGSLEFNLTGIYRPSIKPGTWNIPERAGTCRNIPEHPGTSRNMKK